MTSVLDPAEEIAMAEFSKFEEKLKERTSSTSATAKAE